MLLVLALGGCTMKPPLLTAANPASPAAQTGRLAGAPAALRPGVVDYKDVPATRTAPPPDHSHHHGK